MFQILERKFDDIKIKGTIDQLVGSSMCGIFEVAAVLWKKKYDLGFWQFDVSLIFHNEAIQEEHHLLNGKRQISMDIGMGGALFPKVKEKALEFVPILCTICESLDPFFAFGSHECSFGTPWIDEYSVSSVDRLIERLHENLDEWTTFYLDMELYRSIPSEHMEVWATLDIDCGGKGHLISCFSSPFRYMERRIGPKEKRMEKVFNEHILPLIRERILREYSLV